MSTNYNPSNNPSSVVVDSSLRTISNLIVDQTLDNTAAIMVALGAPASRAGDAAEDRRRHQGGISNVKPALETAENANLANANAQRTLVAAQQAFTVEPTPENQAALDLAQVAADAALAAVNAANAALTAARGPLDALLERTASRWTATTSAPNIAPDEGLSAPFNSWFTLFGQFFDHGLDLVAKGGSGTVFVPLQPDDPLYDPDSHTNFMVLTRATTVAWPRRTTSGHVRRHQAGQHHDLVRRPEPDLYLASLAPGVPARVHARRRQAGSDRQAARRREWRPADLGRGQGQAAEHARHRPDRLSRRQPAAARAPIRTAISFPNADTGFPQVVMTAAAALASGTPDAPLDLVTVGRMTRSDLARRRAPRSAHRPRLPGRHRP